jgi:hypothetical protein
MKNRFALLRRRSTVVRWSAVSAFVVFIFAVPAATALGVTISSFTPATALTTDDLPYCNPTSVTVTGTGFVNDGPTSAVKVTFNGIPATYVAVGSDTTLTVAVPHGATSGPIAVTTAAGTATSTTPASIIPCPGRESSAPLTAGSAAPSDTVSIATFTPVSGKAGATITITGAGFGGVTGVKFSGVSAKFTVVSKRKITAVVPKSAKTGKITVLTSAGNATSAHSFVKR